MSKQGRRKKLVNAINTNLEKIQKKRTYSQRKATSDNHNMNNNMNSLSLSPQRPRKKQRASHLPSLSPPIPFSSTTTTTPITTNNNNNTNSSVHQMDTANDYDEDDDLGMDLSTIITPQTMNENERKLLEKSICKKYKDKNEALRRSKQARATNARSALSDISTKSNVSAPKQSISNNNNTDIIMDNNNKDNNNIEDEDDDNNKKDNNYNYKTPKRQINSKENKTKKKRSKEQELASQKKKKERATMYYKMLRVSPFYKGTDEATKECIKSSKGKEQLHRLRLQNMTVCSSSMIKLYLIGVIGPMMTASRSENQCVSRIILRLIISVLEFTCFKSFDDVSGHVVAGALEALTSWHDDKNNIVSWPLVKKDQYLWKYKKPSPLLIYCVKQLFGFETDDDAINKISTFIIKNNDDNKKLLQKLSTKTIKLPDDIFSKYYASFVEVYQRDINWAKKFDEESQQFVDVAEEPQQPDTTESNSGELPPPLIKECKQLDAMDIARELSPLLLIDDSIEIFDVHQQQQQHPSIISSVKNNGSKLNHTLYTLEGVAILAVILGPELILARIGVDPYGRMLYVTLSVSNVVAAPDLKGIELFKSLVPPRCNLETLTLKIPGEGLLTLGDVKPLTTISKYCIAIIYALDKRKLQSLLTISSSINTLEIMPPKSLQHKRRGKNYLHSAMSDGLIYVQLEHIPNSLNNCHLMRVNANLGKIQFQSWIDDVLLKYDVVKKYRNDEGWNIKNNIVALTSDKLICDEKRVSELHLAFILVDFKCDNEHSLDLCLVLIKPNQTGKTQLLNLIDANIYSFNLLQCIESGYIMVP